jgi:hypothetical protein
MLGPRSQIPRRVASQPQLLRAGSREARFLSCRCRPAATPFAWKRGFTAWAHGMWPQLLTTWLRTDGLLSRRTGLVILTD